MEDCTFCNIINGTLGAKVEYQDDELLVIHDILPKAPVHLLIIPKKHIVSVTALTDADAPLLGRMVLAAKKVADKHGIGETGYKLIFNVGKHGGQIVAHLHLHLIGGKQLAE